MAAAAGGENNKNKKAARKTDIKNNDFLSDITITIPKNPRARGGITRRQKRLKLL